MISPRRLLPCLAFCFFASLAFMADAAAPRPGGRGPAEAALNPALPTIWIAGDSTAAPGGPNATGWGVPFPSYFDPTKVNIANRARGGRSSRTFIAEGTWD